MPDARRIQFLDTATGQLGTVVTLEKPGGFRIISPDGGYIAWVQATAECHRFDAGGKLR